MKKKDLFYIVLAAAIFLVAGYIISTQLLPQNSSVASNGVQVEVVGAIPPAINESDMELLSDPSKTRDFTVSIDLTTGLKNPAPFGK